MPTTSGPAVLPAQSGPAGLKFTHHGAVRGVTGSCHQLHLADGSSLLVDIGLFQGAETSPDGAGPDALQVRFPLSGVLGLVVTHVHIDHVGRLPYLLAAGFTGPIICSQASAALLPLVLEDALEVGFTRDAAMVRRVLAQLQRQLVPLAYRQWHTLGPFKLRLQQAGHILGSAYVEIDAPTPAGARRVVFSGDLGAPFTPLLPAPTPPSPADVLVLESTYGDRIHEARKTRRQRLQALCEHAFANGGTVLIPAFSIGRTQELLCELEDIIHRNRQLQASPGAAGMDWGDVVVVVDSPLAADFTRGYAKLKSHWDDEARSLAANGRHPLDFAQVQTVGPHELHMKVVQHLARTAQPAIVIAASGMCAGGRVVNYLKALLPDARHDIVFCGYQAEGTPGRTIQASAGRPAGAKTVRFDGEDVPIHARVHTLAGYSAHADQADLLNFAARCAGPGRPLQVRLVHGSEPAKAKLGQLLRQRVPGVQVVVPVG